MAIKIHPYQLGYGPYEAFLAEVAREAANVEEILRKIDDKFLPPTDPNNFAYGPFDGAVFIESEHHPGVFKLTPGEELEFGEGSLFPALL